MSKKFKNLKEIQSFLEKEWTVDGELKDKDKERLKCFIKSYPEDLLLGLNINQILLLDFMCYKHSVCSDHGSYSMGWSRSSFINTANSLNRRGLCYWDYCGGEGYDFTLDRSKLISEDVLMF